MDTLKVGIPLISLLVAGALYVVRAEAQSAVADLKSRMSVAEAILPRIEADVSVIKEDVKTLLNQEKKED